MKRLILSAALAFAPTASAATWEYATYADIKGVGSVFSAPGVDASGKNLTDVLTALKCPEKGIIGLLNCVGRDGWELVTFTSEGGAYPMTQYIFKRPKP